MQIQVTGHQLEVTPALRDYATGKVERLTRLFEQATGAHIILSVDTKLVHKAECQVNVPGKQLFADAEAPDLYAAIDGMVERMEVQVRKYKSKLTDHHRAEARRAHAD
ncbi:MAG: ribosome-associated translation inhibitor RaiA [Xanthomonadales bacterium]|nr:ribosome-associated translation inhibitor RaiA [Xanthomonadales bacterium]